MKRRIITLLRIIHTGAVNFVRNASLAIAAMAVMVVTLTIILFSFVTNATFSHTISQITNKIDVSVYLKDSVTQAQANELMTNIRKLPNVKSVSYSSKEQALNQFKQEYSNNQALQLSINETSNPLPATVHIKPINLNEIGSIKKFLNKSDVQALQSDPPSYSGDQKIAIDNISHATDILRVVGVVAVVVFAIISALIIFNTIQMAIFNRREEISIMRLLGASTWYIRGPFIVESAIYGFLSAIISVGIIKLAFMAASGALQASSLGLLDIGYAKNYFDSHIFMLLTLQIVLGIVIGTVSSFIATRRYLKFKT
jgi:cell division transport system permease protein